LAEVLGGEGVPDEDWWVKVDFGHGPESTPNPGLVLKGFGQVRAALEREIRTATYTARTAGLSWSAIGEALGVSKQAAQQRYGLQQPRRRRAAGGISPLPGASIRPTPSGAKEGLAPFPMREEDP